jgi:hypothetical protein
MESNQIILHLLLLLPKELTIADIPEKECIEMRQRDLINTRRIVTSHKYES